MPLTSTARVALYTEEYGEGPRVLSLAGTGGDLRKPPSISRTALAQRCRVLAFDARGCGRSENPGVTPTMEDFADDAAALLDAVGWERAHVVGYSFGGMVAQHLALRHPGRIERLVLAATSPGGAGGASYPIETLEGLEPRDRAKRALAIFDTRIDPAALENPDPPLAQRIAIMETYAAAYMDEPGARAGRTRQLAARAAHDCWDRLGRITHETLVCGGLYDGQASRDAVKNLASRLPHATLRWYPGSHAFQIECPDFWKDVAAFFVGD